MKDVENNEAAPGLAAVLGDLRFGDQSYRSVGNGWNCSENPDERRAGNFVVRICVFSI